MDVCPSGYMNELKFSYYPRSDYVNYLRMGMRQNSCSYTLINSIFLHIRRVWEKIIQSFVYTFVLIKFVVYNSLKYRTIHFYYQTLYSLASYHKKLKMYEAKIGRDIQNFMLRYVWCYPNLLPHLLLLLL